MGDYAAFIARLPKEDFDEKSKIIQDMAIKIQVYPEYGLITGIVKSYYPEGSAMDFIIAGIPEFRILGEYKGSDYSFSDFG